MSLNETYLRLEVDFSQVFRATRATVECNLRMVIHLSQIETFKLLSGYLEMSTSLVASAEKQINLVIRVRENSDRPTTQIGLKCRRPDRAGRPICLLATSPGNGNRLILAATC